MSVFRGAFAALALLTGLPLGANPTGGTVATGTAVITASPGVVTINQATNQAVINWQSFSIGAGELTKFVQPSSASATLNRVLGGQMSIIQGTLDANGQVYLLNGNGILIGPGGAVTTDGFIASTRNITDADFASGNLHFTGIGGAGVVNLGSINALGGDVILIGKTVDNEGEIQAAGHVGMAAADDVLIAQMGIEHVFVRSTSNPAAAGGETGVNNSGTIVGAAAELRAANGNIYALATNNSGIIRANGTATENGHIWLVADGNLGVTQNTGSLVARGPDGQGGQIETSGGTVIAHGTIDPGKGGSWLIDPTDISIDGPTAATIEGTLDGGGDVTEDSTSGSGNINVSAPITWTTANTLNLDSFANLNINSAITAASGTLAVKSGTGGPGTMSVTAAVNVANLEIQAGAWVQNAATLSGNVLPSLTATNFSITGGASFLRVSGGSGTTAAPYQIVDVYGLQGIGSSAALLADSWLVTSAINASNTSTWNSGAGFAPINGFTGTFNGNGDAISGLSIDRPTATNVALFGQVGAAGTILNVILTGASVTGLTDVGVLAGTNAGSLSTSNVAGTVNGTNSSSSTNIGGLAGANTGSIGSSFSAATVAGYGNAGGFVGNNSGTLTSDYATGNTASFLNGILSGSNIGGLVGLNTGPIILSYTTGSTNATDTAHVGGLVGSNSGSAASIQQSYVQGGNVTGYSQVGGLVGSNGSSASIVGGKLEGASTVTGTIDVGGLVGNNSATVSQGSVISTGSILGKDGAASASDIGGFVGNNSGSVTNSFELPGVGQYVGTTDAHYVGGFAGLNTGSGDIAGVYASGNVSGFQNVGGLVGENDATLGIQSTASGTVAGTTNVGGLVGNNTGTVGDQSYATGNVSGATAVGGLLGLNGSIGASSVYATGTVSGTTNVGGLVGSNGTGSFSGSHASGNVSGTGSDIGGLMGQNGGTLTLSSAAGTVLASGATDVGGLVGTNSGSILSGSAGSHSFASGNVTGATAVGGLVGYNTGTLGDGTAYVAALADYTSASGSVTGQTLVGGLVGDNSGTVQQASASGAVNGSSTATVGFGGLVGRNEGSGTVTVSFSSSSVQGNGTASTNGSATDLQVGGLVGANLGAISRSNATGTVVGDADTGGLVGLNNSSSASVATSYSTGTVTGLVATGGLIGYDEAGSITQNYSTSGVSGSTSVGGLVGLDAGSIAEDYSTGTVAGTTDVGGLVGKIAAGGTLTQSYSTGAVSGSVAGGLVGLNGGTVTNSYWDEDTTGQGTTGIGGGSTSGVTGLKSTSGTTAFASASYSGLGSSLLVGGGSTATQLTSGSVAWYMIEGATRPFLAWEAPINNPVTGGAHLIYTAHQLQLVVVSLGAQYVLGQGIDLSATQHPSDLWNTATGFVPIGNLLTPFTGSLSGGGFGITNLYINTPGVSYVGLFGDSSGTLSGISLGGSVTGMNHVGVLVGSNSGPVTGARISGSATGQADVGGVAGDNSSTISSAAVNVTAHGNSDVGGAIGSNSGTFEDSYAIGVVSGTGTAATSLGGLVGSNSGTVTIAYATGNVTGDSTSVDVGGAIGTNPGAVNQTYATGAISGGTDVGGLAGSVAGTVTQSYATGSASGSGLVGGLAGFLEGGGGATRSYASGAVSATDPTTKGGLLGKVAATGAYSNLFWDPTKATISTAVGDDLSIPGAITSLNGTTIDSNTAAYTQFASTGTGFSTGYGGSALVYGSSDNVWRIQKGSEFPFLTQLSTQVSGTAYTSEAHTTPAAGATVTFNSGSYQLNTTTADGLGEYDFLFAADDGLFNYLPHTNGTLRISDSAASADSIAAKLFSGDGVPDLLANITPADTWGGTVRVVSSGLDNALLTQAGSAFVTNPGNNPYGGTNLNISENFDVGAGIGSYSVDGNITATGDVAFDSAGNVPASYSHPVTLYAEHSGGNATPSFTLNATLSSNAPGRAIIVESDGNFVNSVGTGAFSTPSGTWMVYSQNPPGSGQAIVDDDNGLNQLHLYGTDPTQTPAYLLAPGLDYQVYSFTPTLTLTAVATGANGAGNLDVQYGAATPSLTYTVSGLLSGDTVTSGQTFNQVLSNQPGETTPYAQFSPVGSYPVTFIGSTVPTSLIGYRLVFASGNITAQPNSSTTVNIYVSGSQYFGYIGGGATFSYTDTGIVSGDPNFNPTFTTSVGQFANVNRDGGGAVIPYMGTIGLVAASVANYTNLVIHTNDQGFTVLPAALTVTGTGTSIYGNAIATPTLTSNSSSTAGTVYDDSGTGSTVTLASLGYGFTNPSITSASHVGNYSFAVSGTSGSSTTGVLGNYDVTINPGTYSITQRTLYIDTTQNESHTYDATAGPTTFGSSDYTVEATNATTGLVNLDSVTGLMGRTSNTDSNVGHYNYTEGTLGTGGSDYNIVFSNSGSYGLNITPAPLAITAVTATKTYDGTTVSSATPTVGTLYGTDSVTGVTQAFASANVLGTNLSTLNVATYTVNDGNGGLNYTVTKNPATGTISPAALTATGSQVYNGTTSFPGNHLTVAGVDGQTFTATGSGTLTTANVQTNQALSSIGTLVLSPVSGDSLSNYQTFTTANTSVSVTPATLTATGTQQYNGTTSFAGSNLTITGVNGETFTATGAGTLSTANVQTSQHLSSVGTLVLAPVSGDLTSNYNPLTTAHTSVSVTQAPLAINAVSDTKTYDGTTTSTGAPSVVGNLYGATVTGATQAFASANVLGTNLSTLDVTTYTVNDGNSGHNFLVTSSTASGTINPAALTATGSQVYNGTTSFPGNHLTVAGVDGQTFTATGSGTLTTANVQTNQALSSIGTLVLSPVSGDSLSNYQTFTTANTSVSVTPATLTAAGTQQYNGTTSFAGSNLTITGVNGEAFTATGSGTLSTANVQTNQHLSNTGTLSLVPVSGDLTSNYNPLATANSSVSVTPAPLAINAVSATKTYDGTVSSTATPVVVGTVYGTDSVTGAAEAFASANVLGTNLSTLDVTTYTVNDGNSGHNFLVTSSTASGTINPAALTATGSQVYNGTTSFPGNHLTVAGVDGQTFTATGSGTLTTANVQTNQALSSIGTLVLSPVSGDSLSNYQTFTTANTSVSVTPATLTATGTQQYNGTTSFAGGNLTITGVNGETFTATGAGTLTTANVQSNQHLSNTGTLSLVPVSGDLTSNYNPLATAHTSVSVTQAPLAINAVSDTKTYDGTTTSTGAPSVVGNLYGATVTGATQAFASANVMGTGGSTLDVTTYTVNDGNSGHNFAVTSNTASGTISPAALTATGSQVYNGTTNFTGSNLTVAGVDGQTFIASGTGTLATANVQTNQALSSVGTLVLSPVSGDSLSNYQTFAPANTSVSVTPATLTASGTQQYNGTTSFAGGNLTVTGVNGETFTATGSGTLSTANVQTSQHLSSVGTLVLAPVSGDLTSNYNPLATAHTSVSVTPAPLAINAVSDTKTYDGTAVSSATPTVGTLYGTDSVTGATQAFASANVLGTNLSTLDVTGYTVNDGNGGHNYTVTSNTASGTINPAALTATGSQVYNGTTSFTGSNLTITGVDGQTFTASGTGTLATANVQTNQALSSVGTLVLSPVSGDSLSNYQTFTPANTSVSVTPATLAATGTQVYNGTTSFAGSNLTITGVNGETFTATGAGTLSTANVQTSQHLSNTGTLSLAPVSGDLTSNYNPLATAHTSVSVTPAPLAINAVSDTKTYDGTAVSSATPTVGTLYGTDSVTGATQAFASANVLGTNLSTLDVTGYTVNDGNGGHNYTVTSNTASGTINPAALTATGSQVYNGTTSFTGSNLTITGVDGQTFTASGTGTLATANVQTNQALSSVGTLVLSPVSGDSLSNYQTFTPANTSVSVTPATLTATGTQVYNGTTSFAGGNLTITGVGSQTFTATGSGTLTTASVQTNQMLASVAGLTLSAVGGDSLSNYLPLATANTSVSVTGAALSLTATGTQVYNGTTSFAGSNLTITGVSGQTFTATGSGTLGTPNVQTNQPLASVAGLTLAPVGGDSLSNYQPFTTTNTSVSVTAAPLTINAVSDTKTYDGTTTSTGAPSLVGNLYGATVTGATQAFASANVLGTNLSTLDVTGYTVNDGNGGHNFTVTSSTATGTINPATLAATGTQVYNGTTSFAGGNLTVTGVNGQTFTATGSGTLTTASVQTNQMLASVAGLTLSAVGGDSLSNYLPLATANTSVSVTGAALTLTATGTQVYNGTTSFAGSNLTITGVSGQTFTATGSGTLSTPNVQTNQPLASVAGLTLAPVGGDLLSNYQPFTTANTSVSVAPAPLAINAVSDTKTYNGTTTSTGAPAVVGNLYGATVTGATQAFASANVMGTGGSTLDVTTYTVNDGNSGHNFTVTSGTAPGTINPATLAATGTQVYSGTTSFAGGNLTITGVNGETFTATGSGTLTTASVQTNQMLASVAGLTLSAVGGDSLSNYLPLATANTSVSVTGATLSLTATGTQVYNGTTSFAGSNLTITGVSGQTFTATGSGTLSTPNVQTNQPLASVAGLTLSAVGGDLLSNYQPLVTANTSVSVTPAQLAATGTQAYNGATSFTGGNLTITGVNGETFKATGAGTLSTPNVQTNQMLASVAGLTLSAVGGDSLSNYLPLATANTSVSVTGATLSLTATGTQVYNGTTSFAGSNLTITGVSGQTFTATGSGTLSTPNVQTNQPLASVAGLTLSPVGGDLLSNYQPLATANTSVSVTPATLTYVATAASQTYGSSNSSFSGTITGFVNGETVTTSTSGVPTFTSATNAASNVGNYAINGAGLTANNGNYIFVQAAGNAAALDINPAALTITADNGTKVYGQTLAMAGNAFTSSGLQNGQTIGSVGLTSSGAAASAVVASSPYAITPSAATGGTFTPSNYLITYVAGALTVNPAPLTIAANPETKYAGIAFIFNGVDYSVTGLLGADTVTGVTLTSSGAPMMALPGTYSIDLKAGSLTGAGISNYTVTYVPAPFTVLPSSLNNLPISSTTRSELGSLIGAMFEPSYGEKQFYQLEVPGTLFRMAPTAFDGIAAGSSLVDVRIGLENIYSLDRFQSFRH